MADPLTAGLLVTNMCVRPTLNGNFAGVPVLWMV
jgi:hypothetical protein